MSEITNKQIFEFLNTVKTEMNSGFEKMTTQMEQLALRVEQTHIGSGDTKTTARKSAKSLSSSAKKGSKKYNTCVLWFAAMYANNDPSIKDLYTKEQEEEAKKLVKRVKSKSDFDMRKAVGVKIYGVMDKDERKATIKPAHVKWEAEHADDGSE
jgi:hypothetical protein